MRSTSSSHTETRLKRHKVGRLYRDRNQFAGKDPVWFFEGRDIGLFTHQMFIEQLLCAKHSVVPVSADITVNKTNALTFMEMESICRNNPSSRKQHHLSLANQKNGVEQKNMENARREIKTVLKHWPAKDFYQFLREERSETLLELH